MNAVGEDLEESIEDPVPLLRIDLLREVHRAFHIGEQDRDLLTLTLEGGLRPEDLVGEVLGGVAARVALCRDCRGWRCLGAKLGSALTAKSLTIFINRSTGRTSRGECSAALPAEAPTFAILVAAVRAVHRFYSFNPALRRAAIM